MIFVAKPLRYDTPDNILSHMMRVYHMPVPFDKDIFVIDPQTLKSVRTEGDFYSGNMTTRVK